MECHLAARSGLLAMCWVAQAATSGAETHCLTFWRPKVQNQGSSESSEGELVPGLPPGFWQSLAILGLLSSNASLIPAFISHGIFL